MRSARVLAVLVGTVLVQACSSNHAHVGGAAGKVMANLGPDYIVWDKAATIRYRKPGKGKVRAEFRLTDSQIDDIREKLLTLPKYEPMFQIEAKDESGEVIAVVEKLLHVSKKRAEEPPQP